MSSDDHGHGHGSPFVQHHYDDAQHQFDSGKFGIWLFLAQEVLFFSALFVAYVLYRVHHGEIYSYAHKWLDVKYGAINTAVLIFSSLTAAWAVRAAQLGQRLLLIACIAITILCACTFLGIKYIEYSHKVHEHILFGSRFDPCVSPGGMELLTKNNECAGSKSTVVWDKATDEKKPGTGTALEGCFEISKIDLDAERPGIQADCVVTEVTGTSSKPITNRCRDELQELLDGEHAGADAPPKPEGKEEARKFPCWRAAYQPAVCPDLTDGEKRTHGAGARPQAGILVEYDDKKERGDEVKIKAECKAPPPVTAPPLAGGTESADRSLKEGEKSLRPAHILTTHEEHEIESLGPPPEHTNMFFTIYFAMTGLHGIHVLVGVIVFIWLLIRAVKGHFTSDYFGPIDYAALYWHIVDLIWIFLFPLLYLIH
jgi:cytochrome c oxidase subunit 3